MRLVHRTCYLETKSTSRASWFSSFASANYDHDLLAGLSKPNSKLFITAGFWKTSTESRISPSTTTNVKGDRYDLVSPSINRDSWRSGSACDSRPQGHPFESGRVQSSVYRSSILLSLPFLFEFLFALLFWVSYIDNRFYKICLSFSEYLNNRFNVSLLASRF